MKLIIKIARNELRNLVYSPVAWFLAITFMVMCAFFYTGSIYAWAKQIFILLENDPTFIYLPKVSFTKMIFSEFPNGFFALVLPNLYLFVPLLTMAIINREINNGTVRLLYSSPVTVRQIVLGKYLALMLYNLVFVAIIGIFIVSGCFDIKSIDIGMVLSATLGIYLLLCAYTAIGFFMSSLTTYSTVAAIASFTFFFVLMRIGGLWQQYEFVRDLTWFLSINNRTEKMVAGLITSRDVIYYLVIIGMFVAFTILKLRGGMESKPWYVRAGRYVVVLAIGLLIGYMSSRPKMIGYFDTTARNMNTLHPRTIENFNKLKDSALEVTLYVNLLNADVVEGLPNMRNNFLEKWEPYTRFNPGMKFKFEYYYDIMPGDSFLYKTFPRKTMKEIAGINAKILQVDSNMFKSPEEMHKLIDLEPQGYGLTMGIKYGSKTIFTPFFPTPAGLSFDEGSTETVHNAVFKRLLGTRMPRIGFITGELERSLYKTGEREYSQHTLATKDQLPVKKFALAYIGFDVDTLNLSVQDIPADVTTLVMADPKMELNPVVKGKLRNYISNGGNMLLLGEPGKQYVVNPLLQKLGIQLRDGQLVMPTANETADKVGNYFTPATFNLAEEFWFIFSKHLLAHKVVKKDTLPFIEPGMTAISYMKDSGFIMSPLTMTMPGRGWLKMGRLVADSVAPVFEAQEGDIKENNFPTAVQLTRQLNNKEQRIVVCGDADMGSNMRLAGDYMRGIYSWLNYNQFPVYIPFPYAKDDLVITSPRRAAAQKIAYVWVLPGILLVMGTVLLVRRKRK